MAKRTSMNATRNNNKMRETERVEGKERFKVRDDLTFCADFLDGSACITRNVFIFPTGAKIKHTFHFISLIPFKASTGPNSRQTCVSDFQRPIQRFSTLDTS